MAERLEVTVDWLSRFLALADLPDEIVDAVVLGGDLLPHPSDAERLLEGQLEFALGALVGGMLFTSHAGAESPALAEAAAALAAYATVRRTGDIGRGLLEERVPRRRLDRLQRWLLAGLGMGTVVVTNAAGGVDHRLEPGDLMLIDDHVNLTATMKLCKGVMRGMMKARWGRIVNISSVVGATGNPGQANYAASKAGIIALCRTVAKEVAGRGIRVNVVAPGYIDTEMTRARPGKTGQLSWAWAHTVTT